MRPDIEWRVGEDAEQETVVKTSAGRRARRSFVALALAIGLGVALGIIYRSIPEPPAQPIGPLPAPTLFVAPRATVPLSDTIAREVDALARGDRKKFMALQDPTDERWQQEQSNTFESWGTPSSADPLYTIVASGTLSNDRAWAEVLQYRNGQYYRELRFYRLSNNLLFWLRTRPVLEADFWGQPSSGIDPTEHFSIVTTDRNTFEARWVARQFEQLYAQACNALGCWGVQPADRYFTLAMLPEYSHPSMYTDASARHVTVTLPSPMGIYQPGPRTTADLGYDKRVVSYFDQFVYPWMVYNTSGGFERWSKNRNGLILVWAISDWVQLRLGRAPRPALPRSADIANRLEQLPLEAVWTWSDPMTEDKRNLSQAQATVLVQFIDEHYGPDKIIALVRAVREADSLPAALEASGLSYADIAAQWTAWLKKSVGS